jgi:hypothetical protein
VLTDDEKVQMQDIKDMGLEFLEYLFSLPISKSVVGEDKVLTQTMDQAKVFAYTQAKINIEQAVMWAVKGVTG